MTTTTTTTTTTTATSCNRQDPLVQRATSLCEAFASRKPLEEILDHFSDDVVCFEHGLPQLAPFHGRQFQGLQGVRDYFELIDDLLDIQNMKFSDYLVDVEARQVSVRGEASFLWKSNQDRWAKVFMYRLHFDGSDKISRYEVWDDSGAAYLASRGELAARRRRPRSVVLVTYEFTYSPFSGNGILARSIVKSLLHWGCHVTVWCCRLANETSIEKQHLMPPEIAPETQLIMIPIALSEQHGWRKLDDESAWEYFHFDNLEASQQEALSNAITEADTLCAVDWTGAHAARSLPVRCEKTTPLVYMNFRVYSSGVTDEKRRLWFNDMERRALDDASAVVALSERDRSSLLDIAGAASSLQNVEILLPPLRGDMQALASKKWGEKDLEEHLPPIVASVLLSSNTNKRFVTCVARLSPEKNVLRWVRFVEQASAVLEALDLIPLLAGATADLPYATRVKEQLRQATPHAIIIDTFLSPQALVAIFNHTVLNFHPCAYDAYGMTIVEAAACGVPSVLAQGGTVGASALIQEDASLPVSMPSADEKNLSNDAVQEILTLLQDKDRLAHMSAKATQRALEWDEAAYGEKLLEIMGRNMAYQHHEIYE